MPQGQTDILKVWNNDVDENNCVPERCKWSSKVLKPLAWIFMLSQLPLRPKKSISKIYWLEFEKKRF